MENIVNIIIERIYVIDQIRANVTRYIDVVKDSILSTDPAKYKSIVEGIEIVKEITLQIPKEIIKGKGTELLDCGLELYKKMMTIDSNVRNFVSILEDEIYLKKVVYNMSATYTMNIRFEINQTMSLYEKYLDMTSRDDDIIFDIIFENVNIKENSTQIMGWIMDKSEIINKFIIKLIGIMIKNVSGDSLKRLELIIEKQKDMLLKSSRVDTSSWKGSQGSIIRYGLLPATLLQPIEEIFKVLAIQYSADKSLHHNIEYILDSGKGVILLNNSTPSPIEFNLRGLIDLEYILKNDFKTMPQSGLNKKIIERFNTTKMIKTPSTPEPMIKFTRGKESSWIIIETIGGNLYRLLGYYGNIIIDENNIQGLIKGLNTRCHRYHSMQSNEILSKCFDSKAQLILSAYEEMKVSKKSSEPIKTHIIDGMVKWFTDAQSREKIKNMMEFKKAAINEKFINELILGILTKSIITQTDRSAEISLTYIIKFEFVIRMFIKELERRLIEDKTNERIFKELQKDALKKQLSVIFSDIVKKSVDEMDRSSLWTEYEISLKEFFIERKFIRL